MHIDLPLQVSVVHPKILDFRSVGNFLLSFMNSDFISSKLCVITCQGLALKEIHLRILLTISKISYQNEMHRAKCSLSLWRVARGSKHMSLELIHGLFIT
jgi:hypothetical protein